MLIFEVENTETVNSGKLMALTQFLAGRAGDTDSKKQISTKAFIDLAQSLGVNVTADTLGDLIAKEPLSNVLLPYEPNSNVVKFKGNTDVTNTSMDTDQAEKVVNSNAKAAMKRGLSK
jgi:hypothetical protein